MSDLSINQIKIAGKRLRDGKASPLDYEYVHAWRVQHFTSLMKLFQIASAITSEISGSVVVARLKRFESIIDKLRRSEDGSAQVTTMGDIAGCRIITDDRGFELIQKSLDKEANITLEKDYRGGKDSGYRGIHYSFTHSCNGKTYKAELQLRTWQQHTWATAVETYSNIVGRSLKAGKGTEEEKRFFQLASHIMFNDDTSDVSDFEKLGNKLKIQELLQLGLDNSWSIEEKIDDDHDNFLLELHLDEQYGVLTGFTSENTHVLQEYVQYETPSIDKDSERVDIVFSHASSPDSLRKALPNYFMDAQEFVKEFRQHAYNKMP